MATNSLLQEHIGLILDVADTVHDMVHPVVGNSHRCVIEADGETPKGIYNRDLFLDALSEVKYKWLTGYETSVDSIPDPLRKTLCELVAMKQSDGSVYTDVKQFLYDRVRPVIISADGTRARDYEDAVVYYVNKLLDQLGRTDEYQSAKEMHGIFSNSDNQRDFMIDFLPGGVPHFPTLSTHKHSIATLWDPSQKTGIKPSNFTKVTGQITPVGTEHVEFNGESVILKNNSNLACEIPMKVLLSRAQFVVSNQPYFRNSVGALCDFVNKAKTIDFNNQYKHENETIIKRGPAQEDLSSKFINLVFDTLFCKPSVLIPTTSELTTLGKRSRVDESEILGVSDKLEKYIKEHDFFKSYAQFLQSKDLNELIFKVCDMKRSGDYGQISVVKSLVQGEPLKKLHLLTGDRLCYLRCKLEDVPAVLLKPNSDVCLVYPLTTPDKDLQVAKGSLIEKLNKIPNATKTVTVTIDVPLFDATNMLSTLNNTDIRDTRDVIKDTKDYFQKLTKLGGAYKLSVDRATYELQTEINSLYNLRSLRELERHIDKILSVSDYTLNFTSQSKVELTKVNKQFTGKNQTSLSQGTISVYQVDKTKAPAFLHPICDALNRAFDFCSPTIEPGLHYPSETYRHVLTNKDLLTEMVYRSTQRRRSYIPKELLKPFLQQLELIYTDIEQTIDATFSLYGKQTRELNREIVQNPINVFSPPQKEQNVMDMTGGMLKGNNRTSTASRSRTLGARQTTTLPTRSSARPQLAPPHIDPSQNQHSRYVPKNGPPRAIRNAWVENPANDSSFVTHNEWLQQPHIREKTRDDDVNRCVDRLFYMYDMADFAARLDPTFSKENAKHLHYGYMNFDPGPNTEIVKRLIFDATVAFPGHVRVKTKPNVLELWDVYDVAEMIITGNFPETFTIIEDVDEDEHEHEDNHSTLIQGGNFKKGGGIPDSDFRSLKYRFIHKSNICQHPFRVYDALMSAYRPSDALIHKMRKMTRA